MNITAPESIELDPADVPNNCELLAISERDFVAKRPHHVNVPLGTYLRVVNKSRTDFWKIEMKDVCGWVPASHMSEVDFATMTPDEYDELLQGCKNMGHRNVTMFGVMRRRSQAARGSFVAESMATTNRMSTATHRASVDGASADSTSITGSYQQARKFSDSTIVPNSMPERVFFVSPSPVPVPDSTVTEVPGFPLWRSVQDPNTKMTYYFHVETQQTSWFHPKVIPSETATDLVVVNLNAMTAQEAEQAFKERVEYHNQLEKLELEMESHLKDL